ncbi:hypothetical protein AAH994_07570 [Weeksellaceae bacterium A-14]
MYSYLLAYHQENEILEIDDWGYYKGINSEGIATDILTYMITPTGEKIEYNYEENTYSYIPRINISDDEDEKMELVCDEEQYEEYYNDDVEVYYKEGEQETLRYGKEKFVKIDYPQTVNFYIYNEIPSTSQYSFKLKILFYKTGNDEQPESYPFLEIPITFSTLLDMNGNCPYCSLSRYFDYNLPIGEFYVQILPYNNETAYPDKIILSASTKSRELIKSENCGNRKGGGLRIASIRQKNGENFSVVDKNTEYVYTDIDNPSYSSGALVYPEPVFEYDENYSYKGDPLTSGETPQLFQGTYHSSTNYNVLPVQKTQGSDVGYQYITIVNFSGNEKKGKTIYKFSSPKDEPNNAALQFHKEWMVFPIPDIQSQDYKRGLLLEMKVYDENGNILKSNKNTYEFVDEVSEKKGYRFIDPYYNNIDAARQKYLYEQSYMEDNNFNISLVIRSLLYDTYGRSIKTQSSETNYFYENGLQKSIKNNTNYTYNLNDYPIEIGQEFQDSHDILISLSSYATETNNAKLIEANMIGIPLITESKRRIYSNTAEVSITKTAKEYENLLPKRIISYPIGSTGAVEELHYDKYDFQGNLIQYTTKSGIPVTIIWGYNKTQPIAKVEGADYSALSSSQINSIVTASDEDAKDTADGNPKEQLLLNALDAFRIQYSGYQITTYSYDPLIGVRSITPPSGIREYYYYDSENRLQSVRDINGNILKEYDYNYQH